MRYPIGTRFKWREDVNWATVTAWFDGDNRYWCKLEGSKLARVVTHHGIKSLSVEIVYPKETGFDKLYNTLKS